MEEPPKLSPRYRQSKSSTATELEDLETDLISLVGDLSQTKKSWRSVFHRISKRSYSMMIAVILIAMKISWNHQQKRRNLPPFILVGSNL